MLNTFVLLTALNAAAGGTAEAHAIIVFAQPAMNSIVAPGTIAIRLRFNSRIDVRHSRLSVQRPDGTVEAVALAREDVDNALVGQTAAAADGRWTLRWLVLSLDGHITRGEVIFFVRGTQ